MLSLSYFPSPSIDPCYNLPLQRTDFFNLMNLWEGGEGEINRGSIYRGGTLHQNKRKDCLLFWQTGSGTSFYYSGRQVVEHSIPSYIHLLLPLI